MTDSEKLDLLLSEMREVKSDVHLLKEDTQSLKRDVHLLQEDTQSLKQDVHLLQEDTQSLKQDVHLLQEDTQKLSEKTDAIENRMIHTELILENEIRVSIMRVAEGHLDLSRNLHEAMRPNSEVEMLALRVGMLESDMRKVKEKLA